MSSSTPRKPDISPSSVEFDRGRATLRVDSISRIKPEQELEVGNRFVLALSQQLGQTVSLVGQPGTDHHADIVIKVGSDNDTEVQLVECRDVLSQQRETVRDYFETRIGNAVVDRNLDPLQKHLITISADDLASNLPPPGGAREQEIVDYCCETIAEALRHGKPDMIFPAKSATGPQRYGLIISLQPLLENWHSPRVRWPVARTYAKKHLTDALRISIETKLAKHYQTPSGEYWLLIYSKDHSANVFDLNQSAIQETVGRAKATFSRLWYLYLQANNPNGGELTELLSRDHRDQASTATHDRTRVAIWVAPELMRSTRLPRA